jgi:catechol 2,3-dioxygenase-like lactoylglutathione lyase family enzyme
MADCAAFVFAKVTPMIIPSLFAPDLPTSIAFYTDVLGFQKTGAYPPDSGPVWVEMTLPGGDVPTRLWLFSGPMKGRPSPAMSGTIYVLVDDVDALAKRLAGKADFLWGPQDMDYGLREFGVEDPNGYILAFAQEL